MQHLSLEQVVSALETFSKSSARFVLLGSYLGESLNINILPGDYWNINLVVSPFELTGYQEAYSEHTKDFLPHEPEKFLLLYSTDYLKTINFQEIRNKSALLI